MSEPVRSITIEFERMIGVNVVIPRPITFRFEFETTITMCTVVAKGYYIGGGGAFKQKEEEFDLDIAMRMSARRAIPSTSDKNIRPIYRAFRRWMWLAKAAHECHHNDSCRLCPAGHAPILLCRPKQMNDIIAREFGRVEVEAK